MELTNDEEAPMVTSRAMTSSSGNNQTHGETPIANIPYRIYNPFPRTNQVLMHYRTSNTGFIGVSTNVAQQITFRLNSITDIQTAITYAADPDRGEADTMTGTLNIPAMRNFWSCVYDYYTVVRSRYHFRIRPTNEVANHTDTLDIFEHLHGKQIPPLNGQGGTQIDVAYRKRFPHTILKKSKQLPLGTTAEAERHLEETWTDFYGEWYPGTIQHEVEEDELKKTWIKFNNTPPIGEFLTYVFQRASSNPTNTKALFYAWEISIDYEVQLKSLKDQFQYIRPGVTMNFDPPDVVAPSPALVIAANQVYSQIN